MKKMHKRRCLYVSETRGAYCNTDYRMLRVKVVVGKKQLFRRAKFNAKERVARRWDVTKLKRRCFDETRRERSMGSFVSVVEEKLQAK